MRADYAFMCFAFVAAAASPSASQSVVPAGSRAQPDSVAAGSSETGLVELGVRVASGVSEVGRFVPFADPRSGPTLDRFRYWHTSDVWTFEAAADHLGYRDQRYAASFRRPGLVKTSFEWNSVPLWYGGKSVTPFTQAGPGVFRLSDSARAAVQNGTASLSTAFAGSLKAFETRSRRDRVGADVKYSATPSLDLSVSFKSTARTGAMPWAVPFGFSNAIELPATVDDRTNDITTAAEWSNRRGSVRVAYDGSFFANSVDTLVWDNPLRLTDQTHSRAYSTGDGSSQGRMPFWPDSSAHTVSAAGTLALPARSRAVAYVSIGSWLQDAALVPHTINTAVRSIPLPRSTADAKARIVSMLYRVTSRPTPTLWLSGQFRLYDYDNRTPHFAVDEYVRLDGNISTSATGGSHPFDMTRQFVDLDASFTPLSVVAFRAGYGRQIDDRTFRLFEKTVEQTARVSIDSAGLGWGSVRLQYDHSVRTGEGLDEEVFGEIGEQVALRQFDISDRTRDRVSAIVQVLPSDLVGVNASLALGRDERPDAAFGLRENDLTAFTLGIDVTPTDQAIVGLSYGFENLSTLQWSRQASPGPQFDDPTRDWSTDMNEDVHTWTASVDVPRLTSRTGVRALYDFVRSNTQYVYGLAPASTLGIPEPLPALRSDFHRASVDVEYALTRRTSLGVAYRLDRWLVTDFGRSADVLDTPLVPAFVNTLYRWLPYEVHTGIVRLRYRW
jgi:MtrB/PioB family decaheme-associated outer membrane protein